MAGTDMAGRDPAARGGAERPLLLGDAEVRARLDARTAVDAVRAALLAHHSGALAAPPRAHSPLGPGNLVFTSGRLADRGVHGFRVYDTFAGGEQLVAVWDEDSGRILALVHGGELGPRRTGAIGALALDASARPGPVRLGLVGTGVQAWCQLWALLALREVEDVVVAARTPGSAARFASRAAAELGVRVRAADGAAEAVRDRDAVVLATDSPVPVIEADWVAPGTHVSTLGPKNRARHELPPELAARADVIVTDSRAQAGAAADPAPAGGGAVSGAAPLADPGRMAELGAVLAGEAQARGSERDVTLFWSVGLAGTEVALAAALARALTAAE